MRQTIALPLALGIALAAPASASAFAALNVDRPVHHDRATHHRSLAMRAQAPAPATIFSFAGSPTFGDNETDGLSRNPDDCVTYGCIDNGN
jgi:hypothetical protein